MIYLFLTEHEGDKAQERADAVKKLMEENQFLTVSDELWRYDPLSGLWQQDGSELISEYLTKTIPDCTQYDRNEVKATIKSLTYGDFQATEHLIGLSNCVLNLKNFETLPFAPEHYLRSKIPVPYPRDPNPNYEAKCPAIEKFLSEVLQADDIPRFYETVGYCLLNAMPIHKWFIFVGEGANGKSTLLNLIKALLGTENVSNLTLQDICDDKFSAADLSGKFANLSPDLPSTRIKDTGKLLALTGGDRVRVQRKFSHGFFFSNTAKLLFSCNRIPEIRNEDDTLAFNRRYIIFNCLNTFLPELGNCNLNVLSELTDPEELIGLLVKGIEGLKNLLARGHFLDDKTVAEARRERIFHSDPVMAFAEDSVEPALDHQIAKATVYNAYKDFCKEHKLPIVESNIFSLKLKRHFKMVDVRGTSKEGQRMYCYQGIKLKESDEGKTIEVAQTQLEQVLVP